ncbi:D-glucuronyl C5-epimerase B-like isoform X2 [Apostichopus japonicus]|uniref:D-glucuronyl C5-epimerase B-like isoform X2 n=1 Tax=Stichopus japonicus TaxID=307972 RepID=UPI003AB185A2
MNGEQMQQKPVGSSSSLRGPLRMRLNFRLWIRACILVVASSTIFTFMVLLPCRSINNLDVRDVQIPSQVLPEQQHTANVLSNSNVEYDSSVRKKPRPNDLKKHLEIDKDSHTQHLEDLLANIEQRPPLVRYKEIECLINDDYSIVGRREGSEVYLPFSFVGKYFEVEGSIASYDGYERFEWHHSIARIHKPVPYKHNGPFMSFAHYSVENRDRVKYFSGTEGVPISTQWDSQGYFYPIQIAQFGLSHYSKNLTETAPHILVVDDGENRSKWTQEDSSSSTNIVYDSVRHTNVIEFKSPAGKPSYGHGVSVSINERSLPVLSFDLLMFRNSTITVVMQTEESGIVNLHYTSHIEECTHRGSNVFYGIGPTFKWRTITRDLITDLRKGMNYKEKQPKTKRKSRTTKILKIYLQGRGRIDNLTLSSSNHMNQFYDAADWLVRHQDNNGGWPIMVNRVVDSDMEELKANWYSAMAQGQAISTLVRAYEKTKESRYLSSAMKGIKLYQVPSTEGGVQARFMDKYQWYEEYPTNPSSFVLNGFIYSLIGLYDLKSSASQENGREAAHLFQEGIKSLKALLPMFDTGSGSIYDLRHITLGKAPNLARWDYHATHITQLQLIASIDPDPIFQRTLDRWIGYIKGKRAKHN